MGKLKVLNVNNGRIHCYLLQHTNCLFLRIEANKSGTQKTIYNCRNGERWAQQAKPVSWMVSKRGLHDLLLDIKCSLNAIFNSGSSQLRNNFSSIELHPSPGRSQVESALLCRCAALDTSFLAAARNLATKATKFSIDMSESRTDSGRRK